MSVFLSFVQGSLSLAKYELPDYVHFIACRIKPLAFAFSNFSEKLNSTHGVKANISKAGARECALQGFPEKVPHLRVDSFRNLVKQLHTGLGRDIPAGER